MKPTMIGIFGNYDRGAGSAVAQLQLWCNHHGRHPEVLRGRAEQGRPDFRTSSTQGYQPPLCAALAAVAIDQEGSGPDPTGPL
eukprot:9190512-Pyramimonas_sp.AAC.1